MLEWYLDLRPVVLEGLISARYSHQKLEQLEQLNHRLDLLRHQTRLLLRLALTEETNP